MATLYTVKSNTQTSTFGPNNTKLNYVDFNVFPAEGGGNINILNDFKWTTGGQSDEVPYLLLQEMQLNFGQAIQNIAGILTSAANTLGKVPLQQNTDPNDPYSQVYSATPTGFNYVFPHLIKDGDSIKGSIDNTWKRNNIASLIGNAAAGLPFVGKVAKPIEKFMGNEILGSGIGLEDIVTYSSTSPKQLKVSFPLYNTFSEKEARLNFDFINLFGLQNLKTRSSFATFIPPKIYIIESPGQGGIYMPAAYVKLFDVMSIGTTRFMNSGQYSRDASNYQYFLNPETNTRHITTNAANSNGLLIPEAYKVNITFEEIVPQSANIMWGSLGGSKVNVINPTTASENINNARNIIPAAGRLLDYLKGINNPPNNKPNP